MIFWATRATSSPRPCGFSGHELMGTVASLSIAREVAGDPLGERDRVLARGDGLLEVVGERVLAGEHGRELAAAARTCFSKRCSRSAGSSGSLALIASSHAASGSNGTMSGSGK